MKTSDEKSLPFRYYFSFFVFFLYVYMQARQLVYTREVRKVKISKDNSFFGGELVGRVAAAARMEPAGRVL